jgi:hypothetical protein
VKHWLAILFIVTAWSSAQALSICEEQDYTLTPDDVEPLRLALKKHEEIDFSSALGDNSASLSCSGERIQFRAHLSPHKITLSYQQNWSISCHRPIRDALWHCDPPILHTTLLLDDPTDEVELGVGEISGALKALRVARSALRSPKGVKYPWKDRHIPPDAEFSFVTRRPDASWEVTADYVVLSFRWARDGQLELVETRGALLP